MVCPEKLQRLRRNPLFQIDFQRIIRRHIIPLIQRIAFSAAGGVVMAFAHVCPAFSLVDGILEPSARSRGFWGLVRSTSLWISRQAQGWQSACTDGTGSVQALATTLSGRQLLQFPSDVLQGSFGRGALVFALSGRSDLSLRACAEQKCRKDSDGGSQQRPRR